MKIDKFLLVVVIVALLVFSVQAYFVSKQKAVGTSDSALYVDLAENIIHGKGFMVDGIIQYIVKFDSITHPAEYDYEGAAIFLIPFVYFFGKNPFFIKLPSMVLGIILIPTLTYFLGKEFFSKKIGFLSALTFLFCMKVFPHNFSGERDMISAFFIILGIFLFYRAIKDDKTKYFCSMGLVLGFAYLIRPSAIVIFPAIILSYYFIKKTISRKLIYGLAISSLIVAPWLIRNYLIFGDPLFTINRYSSWIFTGTGYMEEGLFRIYWNGRLPGPWIINTFPSGVGSSFTGRSIQLVYSFKILNSLGRQFSNFLVSILLSFAGLFMLSKKNPGKKLVMFFSGWAIFMLMCSLFIFFAPLTSDQATLIGAILVTSPYVVIIITSLALFVKGTPENTIFVFLLTFFVLFFSIIWSFDPRYWIPITPFLLIYSWVGLEKIIAKIANKVLNLRLSATKIGKLLIILLMIFILINLPYTFGKFFAKEAEFPFKDTNWALDKIKLAEKVKNVTEKDAVITGCDIAFSHFYNDRKYIEFPSEKFSKVVPIMNMYNSSYFTLLGCERRGLDDFIYQIATGKSDLANWGDEETKTVVTKNSEGIIRKTSIPKRYLSYIYKVDANIIKEVASNKTIYDIKISYY